MGSHLENCGSDTFDGCTELISISINSFYEEDDDFCSIKEVDSYHEVRCEGEMNLTWFIKNGTTLIEGAPELTSFLENDDILVYDETTLLRLNENMNVTTYMTIKVTRMDKIIIILETKDIEKELNSIQLNETMSDLFGKPVVIEVIVDDDGFITSILVYVSSDKDETQEIVDKINDAIRNCHSRR